MAAAFVALGLDQVPSPSRAPIWMGPWQPCYGAFSGSLNVRAPWGECEFTTRDRCDACARPVCCIHARRYWPHREQPPTRMVIAHRCYPDYIDRATHEPYPFAMLCFDCQAVDLEGGERFLPACRRHIFGHPVVARERSRSRSPQRHSIAITITATITDRIR